MTQKKLVVHIQAWLVRLKQGRARVGDKRQYEFILSEGCTAMTHTTLSAFSTCESGALSDTGESAATIVVFSGGAALVV